MSAHVLLNLLNELGKSRLTEHFMLFRNECNKLNKYRNTNVRLYLSHDIKIILKSYFLE